MMTHFGFALHTHVLILLLLLAILAFPGHAAPVAPWTWDTMSTFVHCSNKSGPLSMDIVAVMANSSFTVIEKYMCLECPPAQTGGETKVLTAAAQIRAENPTAPIFFYFAVDYARRWYDLGVWFDAHPELEVHNMDGTLARVVNVDDGNNTWHIFDFAQPAAVAKWASDIAAVVHKGSLDGVFIDGYRGTGDDSWPKELIPHAGAAQKAAWLQGAWGSTGTLLAATLPPTSVRLPNGNAATMTSPPPGFNAISIEFFGPRNIPLLQTLAKTKAFVEVHSYIGDNEALFNVTLAAYLAAVGENAYFGAGNTWDTCESWLVSYQLAEYKKPLGVPTGPAKRNGRCRRDDIYAHVCDRHPSQARSPRKH